MLKNEELKVTRNWQLLIDQYESRKISREAFCKLHNVSIGDLYKWRKYYLSNISSHNEELFIPLEINSSKIVTSRDDFQITSSIKISNKSRISIELTAGCNRSELTTIIEVLNATE